MALNTIFAEQSLPFVEVEGLGLWLWQTFGDAETYPDPKLFSLTVGDTYTVVWNDTEYSCTAFSTMLSGSMSGTGVGNLALVGGDDTGEPFILGVFDDGTNTACYTTLTNATNTMAIYEEGIVLKDRDGNDVIYNGIETVTFDTTTEGKQQTYTKGVVVEGMEISPDFSAGDMPLVAPDGSLVKSAVITAPTELIPENVRSGKTIAGVTGEFIGDAEEATVSLDFSGGDQVVEPSASGKLMSKVMIPCPDTLLPENIAQGVDIAGIIGTFAGGGDAPKVIMKTFLGTPSLSGVVTLFTADELATIGFVDSSKRFAFLMPIGTTYTYSSSYKPLLFNFIRYPAIGGGASQFYGVTYYCYYSSSSSKNVGTTVTYPWGTAARTNTMYMSNGALVYDVTNSTYKPSDESSNITYVLVAGIYE